MIDLQPNLNSSSVRATPAGQQPRARVRGRVARSTGLLFMLTLAACERSPQVAAVDSLLERDLTLAAANPASGPVSALGDTASSVPASAASSSPNGASPEPTREPPATVSPPPTRPPAKPVPTPRPAPPSAPAPEPTPAPVVAPTPAPIDSSPSTAGSGASNAPATSGRRAIGAGTSMVGATNAAICSIANRPGDRLVAALSQEVIATDGSRLPTGTPILVEMAQPAAGADFAFRVKAVQVNGELIPVEGTVVVSGETTDRRVSKGGDKGKVVTGAIAGAILGRVLGGGTKGAVIGAAGGAAAGTAAAARNSVSEKCLPAGATLTVTLTSPLVLTPGTP